MLARIAIAAVGALIVTGGLLLSMDALTSLWDNRSGERFFRITDILPKPELGRPERPQAGQRQPDTGVDVPSDTDASLTIETPDGPDSSLPVRPEVEITRPVAPPN